MTELREGNDSFRSDVKTEDGEWGYIKLRDVAQGGSKVKWSFVQPDGGPSTDRTVVRWVHSSEVYEMGGLLSGGEFLLTTGLGLHGRSARQLVDYADRLADAGCVGLALELGRTFAGVREALRKAGMLERAVYVERASYPGELVMPAAEVDEGRVPYMSIVVVPGEGLRDDAAGRAADFARLTSGDPATDDPSRLVPRTSGSVGAVGTVHVVGLGPGPDHWLTPQASEVLGRVDHVVGYAPYVDRVPQRAGLTRHSSGNTVELDRARLALQLARDGERVAVVSGGDAGVFGMAAAVL